MKELIDSVELTADFEYKIEFQNIILLGMVSTQKNRFAITIVNQKQRKRYLP